MHQRLFLHNLQLFYNLWRTRKENFASRVNKNRRDTVLGYFQLKDPKQILAQYIMKEALNKKINEIWKSKIIKNSKQG